MSKMLLTINIEFYEPGLQGMVFNIGSEYEGQSE